MCRPVPRALSTRRCSRLPGCQIVGTWPSHEAHMLKVEPDAISRRPRDRASMSAARRPLEGRDVVRAGGAEVDQPVAVHVAADVHETVPVNRHHDVVVRVPTELGRQSLEAPHAGAEAALGERWDNLRSIIRSE